MSTDNKKKESWLQGLVNGVSNLQSGVKNAVGHIAPRAQSGQSVSYTDPVIRAEELLRQHTASQPAAYQPRYQAQMDGIMSQIQNRKPFQYDVNGDALYQQYKDRYIHNGQRAMQDTMGQAAALTGGYGSSYAQNVGQQAYNEYMTGLNGVIPELYQLALDKYDRETTNLQNQYAMYAELDAQGYSRHQDQRSAYYSQLDRLTENVRYEREKQDLQNQQIQEALKKKQEQEAPLDKAKFSRIDEDGNYHYYLGGEDVVFESGINPHTGTMNKDVKNGTFETDVTNYQPNNIGGVPLVAVGKGTINGHEQNVWKKTDDGSLWMWDDTVNEYVPHISSQYGGGSITPPRASNYDSVSKQVNAYISEGKSKSMISSYLRDAKNAGVITPEEYQELRKQFAPRGSTY